MMLCENKKMIEEEFVRWLGVWRRAWHRGTPLRMYETFRRSIIHVLTPIFTTIASPRDWTMRTV